MMQIVCAWCQRILGEKPGEGVSHTVCAQCLLEQDKLLEELKKEQQNVK